jgi:hypothetical protein
VQLRELDGAREKSADKTTIFKLAASLKIKPDRLARLVDDEISKNRHYLQHQGATFQSVSLDGIGSLPRQRTCSLQADLGPRYPGGTSRLT